MTSQIFTKHHGRVTISVDRIFDPYLCTVKINHRNPLNHLTFHVAPFPFPIRNVSPQLQSSRQEANDTVWHSHRGIQVRADVWAQYQAKVRPSSHFIRIQLLISPYWFFLDDHLIVDFWFLICHANIATNCSQATVKSTFTHGKGLTRRMGADEWLLHHRECVVTKSVRESETESNSRWCLVSSGRHLTRRQNTTQIYAHKHIHA